MEASSPSAPNSAVPTDRATGAVPAGNVVPGPIHGKTSFR